ncbi:hypothetical protein E1B28_008617 [Marasmius oreades]|uniref:Cytochrome b561 domain-containing protein n=1 Tax=Marasmius oreades TaxID=181124 RepID=A0A9P7URY4_9AGAR|nr:uncharacterized protein E1B28_008617 [Marasmius oreades]KAG7092252.1 hypothetical protein E1B28_008617 [Marasmius oreades]
MSRHLHHIAVLLSLWLVLINSALGAKLKGDGGCNRFLCVNATVHDNSITYQMTPLRGPAGWLSLGFGRRMANSHVVILWENDDGTTTISTRFATNHSEPVYEPNPARTVWQPELKPANWHPHANTSMSFEIQRYHGQIQGMGSDPLLTDHIWAFSYFRPNSSAPDVHMLQHYVAGRLVLDLNKDLVQHVHHESDIGSDEPSRPVVESTEPAIPYTTHELLVLGHGILASIGFLVLLPIGSLAARWTRTITPKWFKVHHISNYLLGLPVISIGWFLGPLAVFDAQATHFLDAHQICGLLLFGLYLLQILLGRYIHAKRKLPGRSAHPPSNILHACFGLTVIGLAFFQVRSGMDEWERVTGRPSVAHWCHIALKAWAVILPITYFIGLCLLRRQFHQEQQGIGPARGSNYISLASPSSDSPNTSNTAFELGDDIEDEYENASTKEIETRVPLLHVKQ